jgi:hypothetical protein
MLKPPPLALQAMSSAFWEYNFYRQANGTAYPSGTVITNNTNAFGKVQSYITTPAVLREVRELSGCATLTGAPLEDEGGAGTAGTHWEMVVLEVGGCSDVCH